MTLVVVIVVSGVVGIHHFVKYLFPILRVVSIEKSWEEFNDRKSELPRSTEG